MVFPHYRIFRPDCQGNFEGQWNSCYSKFQMFLTDRPLLKACVVHVFVAAGNETGFRQRANQVKTTFSELGIPVSVLSEPPEKPNLVIIEAGFVDSSTVQVEYGLAKSVKFCKLTASGYNEFWFAGIEGHSGKTLIPDSAANAFARLQDTLEQFGLGFNQVVRQWNYVEKITGMEQIDFQARQNYQLFNEARGEFYSRYRTVPDFPAATGIGVAYNGVTIECVTVTGNENLKVIAVNNPKQINSYKYGQRVLMGEPLKNKPGHQPPQFERAKLLTNGRSSRVFVSGTAAIVGQETIGLNDVEAQTRATIENIELLVSPENLKSHCPELTAIPDKYAYVRVYVKNEKDFPAVKEICRAHFGEVPVSFVMADICRADLLVEIEAEKISSSDAGQYL